jgi:hypothetical protein
MEPDCHDITEKIESDVKDHDTILCTNPLLLFEHGFIFAT